ncbi:transposase [Streptomyces erythrochromogenes]|uniref:transposase n=1 Tax=Streptomyces erythrochromogenes TaxID=285574 RepID=UPI00380AB909
MVRPLEVTDRAWTVVEPLLGPSRVDTPNRRQVLNGILWKLFTGAAWRDVPHRYGPWQTVYEFFCHWSADGSWDRVLVHVQQSSYAVEGVGWSFSSGDPVAVGTHQYATGAPEAGKHSDAPVTS